MAEFTSKELYMGNGGQKMYIYRDGFGDVYSATPEEEAEWAKEVIENELVKIKTETNQTSLQFAINNLVYHHYRHLDILLAKQFEKNPTGNRRKVLLSALWILIKYDNNFSPVFQNLLQQKEFNLDEVLLGLNEFYNNTAAKLFVFNCITANDTDANIKAQRLLTIWSQSGLPELSSDDWLQQLMLQNREELGFIKLAKELKIKLHLTD